MRDAAECPYCDSSLVPDVLPDGWRFCACCASQWREDNGTHPPRPSGATTTGRPAGGSTDDTNARCAACGADGAAIARQDGAAGGRGVRISGALAPAHRAALKFSVSQQNGFRERRGVAGGW